MVIYQAIGDFEQTYNFKALIYYGKLWYQGKTMVLWYYGKNYNTIPKTIELFDFLWKKNYGIVEKTMKLL